MGRPKLEINRRKTAGVSVSQEELKVLEMIRIDLKYKSVSALLRSAISKGIEVSTQGKFTSSKDIVYWKYLKTHWNLFEHLEENEELKTVNNLFNKKK